MSNPTFFPPKVTEAEKPRFYGLGYDFGLSDPAAATADAKANQSSDPESGRYLYNEGIWDGVSRMPNRYTGVVPTGQTGGTTTAGVPVVGNPRVRVAPEYKGPVTGGAPVPAPGGRSPWVLTPVPGPGSSGRLLVLPKFSYLELSATFGGKPIAYDRAVMLTRIRTGSLLDLIPMFGVSFELLGDDPDEERRGFRLSGDNGPIARRVQMLIAQGRIKPDPRAYGLGAWVAAKTTKGIKFIGETELERLGLFAD